MNDNKTTWIDLYIERSLASGLIEMPKSEFFEGLLAMIREQ